MSSSISVADTVTAVAARIRRPAQMALLAFALVFCMLAPGSASAVTQGPQWTVTAISDPTYLPPGGTGAYVVEAKNTGGAASDGSEITVNDVLPSGLKVQGSVAGYEFLAHQAMSCSGSTCTYTGTVVPGDSLWMEIPVEVASGAPAAVANLVTVAGGGAPEATRETPTTISSASAPFGIAPGSTATALSSTQAGAHADLTTSLGLTTDSAGQLAGAAEETGSDLPPGFVADVAHAPKCSSADFSKEEPSVYTCPLDSQIGSVTLTLNYAAFFGLPAKVGYVVTPVYALTTNPGEIARFGFFSTFFGVEGTVTLRPGDYGGRVVFKNIHLSLLEGASLTVWGVPSAPIHNALRGLQCLTISGPTEGCEYQSGGSVGTELRGEASSGPQVPFFTNETQCTGEPVQGTLFTASWEEPTREVTEPSTYGTMTGCPLTEFGPYITAAPDTTRADTPAGFTFDVKMPQEGLVERRRASRVRPSKTRRRRCRPAS